MNPNTFPAAILAFAALTFPFGNTARGQVTTDIVGFNQVNCRSNSDTVLSVPFMKQPLAHQGAVSTAEATAPNRAQITPTFPGTWTNDQFANKFYLRFTTGNKAGFWYDVVSNNATSLTIDLNGDAVTGAGGVVATDKYVLVEHWTLDNLFPPTTQTTVNVSPGNQVGDRRTEVLLPNVSGVGVNLPPEGRYFLTAAGWQKDVSGSPAAGNAVLPPGSTFIVRHNASSPATSFSPVGVVLKGKDVVPLATSPTGRQDNNVAIGRPVAVKLTDAGLGAGIFTQSIGHLAFQKRDLLYVFDNTVSGFNKPASSIYYNVAGTWYRDAGQAASNPVANNDFVFQPGSGVVVRKFVGTGETAMWVNQPGY